ncbi:MAG: TetR/AcrR family transcriptional regulator [Proteobacteria bacterium]|nr:TetR/AcrR family transcriptional regulator [Pseudomonadota bacterium]MCP4919795.1 TetR/AcrR family transcriptional regulator [Pseudomonadota bacterium]
MVGRPRETSDEEILDAARRLFLEHGPQLATSKIAAALGISAPALFHRFGNKRALLIAAICPRSFPISGLVYQTDQPIEEQLLIFARALRQFSRMLQPVMSLAKAAGIDNAEIFASYDTPPPILLLEKLDAFFVDAQAAGVIRECPPRSLSLVLIGAIQGPIFLTFHLGQPVHDDFDAYIEDHVANFLRGAAA